MNPKVYFTEEHETTIRSLFWKLVFHWKLIVLAACLFAVLGYGYARFKQVEQKNMGEQTTDEGQDVKWFDFDNVKNDTLDTISRYETALNNENNYMKNSLLMQVDPYHVFTTTRDFEISIEENADINELNMISRQLTNSALKMETLRKIAEKYNSEPQYVREMLSSGARDNLYDLGGVQINTGTMPSGAESIIEEANGEKCYFFVNAKANDMQFTIDAVQLMTESVMERCEELKQYNFTLKPVSLYSYETVDTSVITTQNDSRVRAYDYSDRLVKLKTTIENIEKARESSLSVEGKHVSAKKYALLGFAGGAVLIALVLILKSIMSASFQTEEDFRSWFVLKNLGTCPFYEGKQKANSLKLRIMEELHGSSVKLTREDFFEMTSINIENAVKEKKNVLLTGSVSKDDMQKLSEQLAPRLQKKCEQTVFTFAEDVMGNPETRINMQNADSVVLVEKRNHSKIETVREEIEVIVTANKEILGVILL